MTQTRRLFDPSQMGRFGGIVAIAIGLLLLAASAAMISSYGRFWWFGAMGMH